VEGSIVPKRCFNSRAVVFQDDMCVVDVDGPTRRSFRFIVTIEGVLRPRSPLRNNVTRSLFTDPAKTVFAAPKSIPQQAGTGFFASVSHVNAS